jgi:hypothetical protein
MMKRATLLILWLLLGSVSFGALASPAVPSYLPGGSSSQAAVLYFRYQGTPYLGREKRTLLFDPASSYEKALVQALLDGPSAVYAHLVPLFPEGTRVLGTRAQGNILFVTFNENIMNPYTNENNLADPLYREGEGRLRRTLAMSALSCTITENTSYAYVQVLVEGAAVRNDSLRLPQSYYLLESDILPPPLSRDEGSIMKPHDAVELMCQKWALKDLTGMGEFITANGDSSEAWGEIPLLTGYTLSPGTISHDGTSAMVLLSAAMQLNDGTILERGGWPLRLQAAEGIWLIQAESLLPLWGAP